MFERSGGRARNGVGQGRRRGAPESHAVGACGERRAHDGAEILRVFDAVEKDEQRATRIFFASKSSSSSAAREAASAMTP